MIFSLAGIIQPGGSQGRMVRPCLTRHPVRSWKMGGDLKRTTVFDHLFIESLLEFRHVAANRRRRPSPASPRCDLLPAAVRALRKDTTKWQTKRPQPSFFSSVSPAWEEYREGLCKWPPDIPEY